MSLTKEDIKQIALDNGFKLKTQPDGTEDLNPYVYDFAQELIREFDPWFSFDSTVPWRE